MTKSTEKKLEYGKEIEAIFISLFAIFAFIKVPDSSKISFTCLVSLIVIALASYIRANDLRLAKSVFYILLAFFNVSSLLYMVQYLIGMNLDTPVYQFIFKAFSKDGAIQMGYVIWVFVLTLYLMIVKDKKARNHGDDHGR